MSCCETFRQQAYNCLMTITMAILTQALNYVKRASAWYSKTARNVHPKQGLSSNPVNSKSGQCELTLVRVYRICERIGSEHLGSSGSFRFNSFAFKESCINPVFTTNKSCLSMHVSPMFKVQIRTGVELLR